VDDIPDPRNHPQECGHPENVFHSLLCDPDQILLHEAQQTVTTALMALAQQGTEVMVVLISRMDEEAAFTADHDVHVAAESMALALHDRFQSPGVLVFLSIADRAVYFSTSEPLESILSSEDIAQTIATMRPFLQQADYAAALQSCVESLRHRIRGDGVTPLQSTASSATEDAAAAVDQQEPNQNETSPSNSTATATATTLDPLASSTTIDEQTAPPPDDAPPSDDHDHGDDHSDDGDEDHFFFFGGYGDDEPTGPMDAGDTQTPTPAAPAKASLLDDSSLKDLVRGGLLGTAVYCGLRTVTSWARHRRPPAARPAAMTKRPTMTAVAALLDRPSSSHAAAAVKPIGTSEANVRAVAVAQQAAVTSRSSRQLLSHRPSSTAATDVERGAVTDTDTLLSPLPWRAAAVSGTHKGSSPTTAAATTTTTTTTSASTVPRPSHQRGGYWTLARRILHYVTPDPGSPATTPTTTTAAAGTSKRTHFSRDEQSTDRWMSSSSSSHRSGTQPPQPRRRVDGDRW
jgi:hypothetical protein